MVGGDMPGLSVGQSVSVPWGLDELEGTIVRIYSTGLGKRVVVAVRVPGTGDEDDEATLTLPIESVEPRDTAARAPAVGAWVAAAAYERAVSDALHRVASELGREAEISEADPDQGIDLVLHSGQSVVFAQLKYLSSRSRLGPEAIDRALAFASQTDAPFMLVSNVNLALSARNRFRESEVPRKFSLVKWRGAEDDDDLRSELRLLLAYSG